jgi:hypothetical protein
MSETTSTTDEPTSTTDEPTGTPDEPTGTPDEPTGTTDEPSQEPAQEPTEQPGDGTAVNPVPDAPNVVDPPTSGTGDTLADVLEQVDDLKARVRELEDRVTDPEAPAPAAPVHDERLVEWDDHDEWGNPRVFYGVNLGPDPYDEGRNRVARLVPGYAGVEPGRLRPLES